MEEAEGLLAVFGADHPITGQLQAHHQHPAHGGFIVHHQHGGAQIAATLASTGGISAIGVEAEGIISKARKKGG